jgi:hypothetical protein
MWKTSSGSASSSRRFLRHLAAKPAENVLLLALQFENARRRFFTGFNARLMIGVDVHQEA